MYKRTEEDIWFRNRERNITKWNKQVKWAKLSGRAKSPMLKGLDSACFPHSPTCPPGLETLGHLMGQITQEFAKISSCSFPFSITWVLGFSQMRKLIIVFNNMHLDYYFYSSWKQENLFERLTDQWIGKWEGEFQLLSCSWSLLQAIHRKAFVQKAGWSVSPLKRCDRRGFSKG